MKKNLFISLYPEKDNQRLSELKTCLEKNSKVFDQIYVLLEKSDEFILDGFEHKNIQWLPITVRPTFRSFFNAINSLSDINDINILANSDIYFEDLIALPKTNECFALTRYEVDKNGTITFLNRKDSSDVWVFNGFIKIPKYADFHNLPGCDNRINWELKNVGYDISNPSLTIKTYHLHHGAKSYDGTKRINKPYHFLAPTAI